MKNLRLMFVCLVLSGAVLSDPPPAAPPAPKLMPEAVDAALLIPEGAETTVEANTKVEGPVSRDATSAPAPASNPETQTETETKAIAAPPAPEAHAPPTPPAEIASSAPAPVPAKTVNDVAPPPSDHKTPAEPVAVSSSPVALSPAAIVTPAAPVVAAPIAPSPPRRSVSSATPLSAFVAGPEVAIILAHDQFYPSRIRLKAGETTRLLFTTVNRKPAALVMEQMQIQRWVAGESESPSSWEITREISATRITEVVLEPKTGSYSFHDALTGAVGEILVEN